MKFLSKRPDSRILAIGLMYLEGNSRNNQRLRKELLIEQWGFCAYTEKFLVHVNDFETTASAKNESTETIHVEHFDASQKGKDDYHNYYAVCGRANEAKIGKVYRGGLFFQDPKQLYCRIAFKNGLHWPINDADSEAQDLIDFLGFDEPWLANTRKKRIKSLRSLFGDRNQWTQDTILEFFKENRQELSFPTAIEAEFGIDLSRVIAQTSN